jgi:prevent-host-death family protein
MEIVNSYEAKSQLSKLIQRALNGERIVIARAGEPLVELTPYKKPSRRTGAPWRGKIKMADDFDAPMPELEEAIYGADG